jgi:hypothetical protein
MKLSDIAIQSLEQIMLLTDFQFQQRLSHFCSLSLSLSVLYVVA